MALVLLEGEPTASEPGVLKLTDRQVQQAGVRLGSAQTRDLVREIDATGRIVVDERRQATLTSWIPGRSRIDRLHVNFTGAEVELGQVLVEVYNSTLATAVAEYRLALQGQEALRERGAREALASSRQLAQSARDKLLRFGLTSEQVDALDGADTPASAVPTLPIRATLAGTVLQKRVEQGQYVEEGDPLLHIADLTHLWVHVDIYEYELPLVKLGQTVEITTRAVPDRVFEGTVTFIDRVAQEKTRTIRVRCELENPDGLLKPGLYARARIRSRLPDVLSVPESAVLRSGRRDVVLVSEGEGRFRPKRVQLGRTFLYPDPDSDSEADTTTFSLAGQDDRYHEVFEGLSDGDRVVVAGGFLLNAEAQFQGILKKMIEEEPVAIPAIPDESRSRIAEMLEEYLAIASALVKDDLDDLQGPSQSVLRFANEAGASLEDPTLQELQRLLERIATAGGNLAESKDLQEARRHFANLSREVITFLRDFDPGPVEGGDLHLFRCPMANDAQHGYGFELWVQKEPDIANPYMGPAMPG